MGEEDKIRSCINYNNKTLFEATVRSPQEYILLPSKMGEDGIPVFWPRLGQ